MPTPTYDLIDSQVLSTSAASVSFTSIPATYRDLVVVVDGVATANSVIAMRFNNDSFSTYTALYMYGNGSIAVSGTGSFDRFRLEGFYTGTKNLNVVNVLDYSATDKHKTILARNSIGTVGMSGYCGRWPSNSAINQVTIFMESNSFAVGSTFYLYGIVS